MASVHTYLLYGAESFLRS